ncbi:penicillin-binding transpeptidase domain-containing protein [Pseudoalteromonas sp. ZZD1]|uniref:penicillin-binding transpeptidase domain-containing protein n=1 Tax=Pseudoalteromonas sp. ZZD1 TaxID=3139395 RepID=UPI003BAAD327
MQIKKLYLSLSAAALGLLLSVFTINRVQNLPQVSDPVIVTLPAPLTALNKDYTLDINQSLDVSEQVLGNNKLLLIKGKLLKEVKYSLQETGYKNSVYRATLGLNATQYKAHFELAPKLERYPILDTKDLDLPGFTFRGQTNALAISALENTNVIGLKQSNGFYWFNDSLKAIVHNDKHALLLARKSKTSVNFNIKVFEFVQYPINRYFVLTNKLTDNSASGWVKSGYYPVFSKQDYVINVLQKKLVSCNLLKKDDVEQEFKWVYANAYQYKVSHHVSNYFMDKIVTEDCRGALKSLWHSPSGNALRKRVDSINLANSNKFIIGIESAMKAHFHAEASLLQQIELSFEDLLTDSNEPLTWYRGLQSARLKFNTDRDITIYGFNKQINLEQGYLKSQVNMCLPKLCDEDLLYKFILAPKSDYVVINVLAKSNIKLVNQSNIALDAAPQPHEYLFFSKPSDNAFKKALGTHSIVKDRKGKNISINQLPTLLAPFGGRLQSAGKSNVTLTLDLDLHLKLQNSLEQYEDKQAAQAISLTVVNDEGEILALPQTSKLTITNNNIARQGYAQSWQQNGHPLTMLAGFHDDSIKSTSGSTVKLLTALALVEKLGVNNDYISGLSLANWQNQKDELNISVEHGCYPFTYDNKNDRYSCSKNAVTNFIWDGQTQTIFNRMARNNDKNYGLNEAMRDSLNGYFAALGDHYLAESLTEHLSFSTYEAESSQLRALASQFGFYQNMDLSGGLLKEAELKASILNVRASRYKNYRNKNQFHRALIGEQTTVTPLQIAQMTLAFAKSGKSKKVTLLKSIEGKQAEAEKLKVNVSESSFKRVNESLLFAAKSKSSLKDFDFEMFAKTGTGERGDEHNNAWLTAWFYYNDKPVVLVCQALKTKKVGGEICGPVISSAIKELLKQ